MPKSVKKLFAFFSKEKATKKPIVSFDRVYQKTSKALGVSYTISSECSLSQNNKKHYNNIFS
jgi:uroporphyrinogen-III synthase